jgi:hypothetical protein
MLFLLIVIWVVGLVGWILNIVKIVKALKANGEKSAPVTPMFIARCIGVLAVPLGAVLGFMS